MKTRGIAAHAGIFTGTGQVGIPGQYPRPEYSGSPKFLILICVKGSHMTIYITLGNLRRAAFEKFDSIEERDRKAKQIIESFGGKMLSMYYTFGRYDFVVIIDMPSKENLVKFLSIVAKHGTVRTETLETIPADMFYKIAQEV